MCVYALTSLIKSSRARSLFLKISLSKFSTRDVGKTISGGRTFLVLKAKLNNDSPNSVLCVIREAYKTHFSKLVYR